MFGKILDVKCVIAVLAFALLVACDSQLEPDRAAIDGSSISVPLPQRLRAINDVDPAAVTAFVTVNGVQSELQRDESGRFVGDILVSAQSDLTVRIDFFEQYAGQQLMLARAEKSVDTNAGDTTLTLFNGDYDFDSFDFDGDNVSNIVERQNNTDPLDAAQQPAMVQVEVFAALPATAVAAGFTNYNIEVSVADQVRTVPARDGLFRSTFEVPSQDSVMVNLRLIELSTGQNLTVGSQSRVISNPPEYSLITFVGTAYELGFDQDNDGVNNLDELLAGSDVLGNPPAAETVNYAVVFDVPQEIFNPGEVYSRLWIDGENIDVIRSENTYTATATAAPGATVNIEAEMLVNYLNTPLVVASFSGAAQPADGGTLVLDVFSLQHDADNDGILNFTEINDGTDPFNAPPQCTVITDSVFATLTDDAYQSNNRLFTGGDLRVGGRRTTLIRYQHDESTGSVIAATLYLTVGADEGDGLINFYALPDFEWNDQARNVDIPTLESLVGAEGGEWDASTQYAIGLDPSAVSSDFTVFITQSDGNDVSFTSSDSTTPPLLEVLVERCE